MGGQLKGKIAVITGSTQGLGAATARLFAERGAQGLVICGRSAEKGRAQAAGLEELGAKAVFVQADLEKVEDCRRIVAEADRAFGRLDILVNAAGLFDRLFAVNTRAPLLFWPRRNQD
ncbi:short chain dehydrogenase [Brucella neotomae]|uniref:Short-chain dehydrogenase/reductase SDR n=1 Tax=Brucella neotomae 5K33 TaxID=520456 RepID=A0A7U8KAR8_BRUNE|nr:short-chain dehydrogenase/reductase SDR [Brucella neotomae 5K33]KFJ55020.1 short chain dehydrogenase family protein [Brucella neotomae 5K33]SPU67167.1 short chain dehydrogenase [Brucella neotomae]SPU68589.1 short chain dehydrogenase [Brucella neotomae]SUW40306.1 short chain dehydrogenase [Brucella neotomae]